MGNCWVSKPSLFVEDCKLLLCETQMIDSNTWYKMWFLIRHNPCC